MTNADEVPTIQQLLDKQLSAVREHVDERFAQLHQDSQRTNERITKQSHTFHEDQSRLNNRLDLVAAQVAKVDDDVAEVKEIVSGHSEDLNKIQRRFNKDLDRLDDHGERIERLEAKTAHLSVPPTSR